MFEMEKVDKEILEYLTKNIPNFQYTKLLAHVTCKDLNNDIRYEAFNVLSTECSKFIKRNININNEANVTYLLLFQDMIISHVSNMQLPIEDSVDGDIGDFFKTISDKIEKISSNNATVNKVKTLIKILIKEHFEIESKSILRSLLLILLKSIEDYIIN